MIAKGQAANASNSWHLEDDPSEMWVSSRSQWKDSVWYLDYDHEGIHSTYSSVRWDFDLPNGQRLTDPQWSDLLDSLKRFTWSLIVDRQEGTPLKVLTLHRQSFIIRWLVAFMAGNGIASLNEIKNEMSWSIFSEYVDDCVDKGDDLNESRIRSFVAVFRLLREQAPLLERIGAQHLPEDPFDGQSASEVARQMEARISARIPPLPDEVALPIMAAADRLIWKPADEIIELFDSYISVRFSSKAIRVGTRMRRARILVKGYQFSTLPGESEPWRAPIQDMESIAFSPAKGVRKIWRKSMRELHQLVLDLRNACVIVLQSQTGMRIGEIASIKGGWNSVTGMPACIVVRKSRTGLNELFFIKATLYKTREAPEEAEWLVGMRPMGSSDVPTPVRAIEVLHRLFDHSRKSKGVGEEDANLIMSIARNGANPIDESGIGYSSSYTYQLWNGQKEFAARYVDLSALRDVNERGEDLRAYRESCGTILRTHQWRKNYAQYLWRVDNRMIPAIAQQFKHLSLAMTEEAYIGNDPTLLSEFDSLRTRSSVDLFRAWARGEQPATGHLAKRLRMHQEEVANLVSGRSSSEADDIIERYVIENDLRIWFAVHGKCMIGFDPEAARCHGVAGTSSWQNKRPNYRTREPSICAGCPCFYVDHDHKDYWTRRYVENAKLWATSKHNSNQGEYRISRSRAEQAAAVLRAIKAPIPELT